LEAVHLRIALQEAMRLASEVNRYLDQNAPWNEVKAQKAQAALTIYTALRAIDSLKVLFAPFLPFSSEALHQMLGYATPLFGSLKIESITDDLGTHNVLRYLPNPQTPVSQWHPSELTPGQALGNIRPLFRKLDEAIVEEERARLGKEP
ncbi:MAG: class I tRNA ligase family protein, partial [Anaerolineales bacterium]